MDRLPSATIIHIKYLTYHCTQDDRMNVPELNQSHTHCPLGLGWAHSQAPVQFHWTNSSRSLRKIRPKHINRPFNIHNNCQSKPCPLFCVCRPARIYYSQVMSFVHWRWLCCCWCWWLWWWSLILRQRNRKSSHRWLGRDNYCSRILTRYEKSQSINKIMIVITYFRIRMEMHLYSLKVKTPVIAQIKIYLKVRNSM